MAAAKAAGLYTLRLHIKAFDPAYLEVCDELGMLLHCDVPVAEPIAHEELAGAGELADPTRPLIENDWIEPDPERVFTTPVLTAHWYGRLHTAWLAELDAKARRWAGLGRPLFVTEFGDWGLPQLGDRDDPPFWWPGRWYREAIAACPGRGRRPS